MIYTAGMSDDAKRLAREWIEIWDRGEPRALPLADEFVHVSPFGRIEGRGRYLEVVEPIAAQNVASLHVEQIIAEVAPGPASRSSWTLRTDQFRPATG